jgi:DNA-binding transcriptional LysR family regulator
MKRSLPSTSELLAFQYTVMTGSVSRAAEALCVTPGAISRHLSALEARLGANLLGKHGRGLKVTAKGAQYYEVVRESLGALSNAQENLRSPVIAAGRSSVRVLSPPTLTARWLMPKLGMLRQALPSVEIRITPWDSRSIPPADDYDLALLYELAVFPEGKSEVLAASWLVPIWSPRRRQPLAARPDGCALPATGAQTTLLTYSAHPHTWQSWLKHRPELPSSLAQSPVLAFDQANILIEAAASDLGVGLVPYCLVREEIESGRLATDRGVWEPRWGCYRIGINGDSPVDRQVLRQAVGLLRQDSELARGDGS